MIRRSRLVVAVAAAVATVLAHGLAHAEPRLGIELLGGWSRYEMAETNDSLSSFNQQVATQLDAIHDGPELGAAVTLSPHPRVLLRAEYERLVARTEDQGLRFDVSSDAYTLGVTYLLPAWESFRYGLGLGVGICYTRGELSVSGVPIEMSGGGSTSTRVTAEALQYLGSALALHAVVGYRHAPVDPVHFEGAVSNFQVDYSGPFFRIGLVAEMRLKAR